MVYFPPYILISLAQVLKSTSWEEVNYYLIPVAGFLYIFASVTVPYIIVRQESWNTYSFRELWDLFRESLVRLISLFIALTGFIFILMMGFFLIMGIFFGYKSTELSGNSWIAILLKIISYSIIYFLLEFSFAGISLHKLHSFQALVHAVLMFLNNKKWVIFNIVLITSITLFGQITFRAVSNVFRSYYFWYFIQELFLTILTMFFTIVMILIYQYSSSRIRYRWVRDTPFVLKSEE